MIDNKKAEVLILGLGNPILSDDSVGLRVVDKLKEILNTKNNFDFYKVATSGIELLDIISGYKHLILIDVIKTGKEKIGTLTRHKISDFNNSIHLTNPHQLNFPSVIEFANKTGIPVPEIIDIFTVEVDDIYTFSLECSELMKKKIPVIADKILKELHVHNSN